MIDAIEESAEVEMVLKIAESLRTEFGVEIDSHPGGRDSEAGAVNRSFRAAVRNIVAGVVNSHDDLDTVLTGTLRRAAQRRLTNSACPMTGGEDPRRRAWLGDAWLAYIVLPRFSVIEDVLGGSAIE